MFHKDAEDEGDESGDAVNIQDDFFGTAERKHEHGHAGEGDQKHHRAAEPAHEQAEPEDNRGADRNMDEDTARSEESAVAELEHAHGTFFRRAEDVRNDIQKRGTGKDAGEREQDDDNQPETKHEFRELLHFTRFFP